MGKGSHLRFQFPTEVRRKSCSAVVRGKEMKFGLSQTISSQLILCYNHTLSLHMNSITSERLCTHISVQCEWSTVCVYCHSKVKLNVPSEQEASVPPRRHHHVTQNQVKGQIVVNCMVKGLPLREVTLVGSLFRPRAGWSCSCSLRPFSLLINRIATSVFD